MKNIIIALSIFFTSLNVYAIVGELIIKSQTSTLIKVAIYPDGAVFNGIKEYNIKCFNVRILQGDTIYDKIYGGTKDDIENLGTFTFDHDGDLNYCCEAEASIGYGKYRIDFYELINSNYEYTNYCYVDYGDFDYPYDSPFTADISVYYHSSNDIRVWNDSIPLPEDRTVKIWDQRAINPSAYKTPNKFGFVSNFNFTNYPISAANYGATSHINPGNIYLNTEIKFNSSISNMVSNPTIVSLKEGIRLTLDSEKVLDVIEVPPFSDSAYFEMEVEANSGLILESGSHFILRKGNKLVLDDNSRLYLGNNAQLSVKSGASLYNYGASVRGNGRILFENTDIINQLADYIIQDSVKFVLDSNAVVSIPNNTTLHFKGNTTSLIMNPGSKLLIGENSGIVCDSGGKVIANNATFGSVDSTKKWNGISLNHISQDTIKNCIIKNAMYGISISDKYDAEDTGIPYSTEISGCSFVNQTNYVLNSGVYIAGSNNVLIMNNTILSTSLQKGFTHGIYTEYCPEGVFNIIGNNIGNSGNGMTLIGCSPFAAQNIITGNEYSECGLFLDNSNGTFEYNVISDFYSAAADHIFPITLLLIC